MKLFSTIRRDIPTALIIASSTASTRIQLPRLSVNRASRAVAATGLSASPSLSSGPINTSSDGNSKNEVRKVTTSPMDIIQPKSITGLMPLNTSEQKPMMVVSAVYKHGQNIFLVASQTRSMCFKSGWSIFN